MKNEIRIEDSYDSYYETNNKEYHLKNLYHPLDTVSFRYTKEGKLHSLFFLFGFGGLDEYYFSMEADQLEKIYELLACEKNAKRLVDMLADRAANMKYSKEVCELLESAEIKYKLNIFIDESR